MSAPRIKRRRNRRRFVVRGQQPHPEYGMIEIRYAYLNANGLSIGWKCDYGFGVLAIRQNQALSRNETVAPNEPGYWVFTPEPGLHLDTECMGPEFVGEVMKAFYWAGERGQVIPDQPASAAPKDPQGNCPTCDGILQHSWADYLGWTNEWYFQCSACKSRFESANGQTEAILAQQPHIILNRSLMAGRWSG